jgi:hypothetical protein
MAIGDAPNDIYHNGNFYNRNGQQVSGVNEIPVVTVAKVMTNGDIIFTASGDVQILDLVSECVTPNDATASTLQYSITPTVGTPTTISGASASLASAAAGTVVTLVGDALATAPVVSATGVALSQTARGIWFPSGTLKLVIGVGPTTGTWKHYIKYAPLEAGAVVS